MNKETLTDFEELIKRLDYILNRAFTDGFGAAGAELAPFMSGVGIAGGAVCQGEPYENWKKNVGNSLVLDILRAVHGYEIKKIQRKEE